MLRGMKKLVSLLSAGLLAFNLLMPVKAENLETRIKASEIQEEITIDGKLGEEAWQKAEKVHGFYFKKENKDAANTLVYICQDKKNLYIAFDCPAKPEEIIATETKRDGIVRDDFAGIMIEPYGKKRNFYTFIVNPLGTQEESVPEGSADKVKWKGEWQAAASIDKRGWTAEMAIPFSILNYPKGQDTFNIIFYRYIHKVNETFYWPGMKEFDYMKAGSLTELELPVERKPWKIMPYFVFDTGKINNEDEIKIISGIDVKKNFGDLTLNLTYNPDPTVIEDVLSLDFTYSERIGAEKRAYFLDGAAYYPSIFNSRKIPAGEIRFAGKLYGKIRDTDLGVLISEDSDRIDSVLRLYHYLTKNFAVGVASTATNQRERDFENYVYGLSLDYCTEGLTGGRFKPSGTWDFGINFHQSKTSGEATGENWSLKIGKTANEGFEISTGVKGISQDYNPGLGFIGEKDFLGGYGVLRYKQEPDGKWIKKYSVASGADYYNRYSGGFFDRIYSLDSSIDFSDECFLHHSRLSLGALKETRNTGENIFNDEVCSIGYSWKTNSDFKGGAGFNIGKRVGYYYDLLSLNQGGKFGNFGFNVGFQSTRQRGKEIQRGIFTGSYDLLVTPEKTRTISGRVIIRDVDESKINAYLSYRQTNIKTGSELLILIGDPNTEETTERIMAKLSKIFYW